MFFGLSVNLRWRWDKNQWVQCSEAEMRSIAARHLETGQKATRLRGASETEDADLVASEPSSKRLR